jgi:hypothetical protein
VAQGGGAGTAATTAGCVLYETRLDVLRQPLAHTSAARGNTKVSFPKLMMHSPQGERDKTDLTGDIPKGRLFGRGEAMGSEGKTRKNRHFAVGFAENAARSRKENLAVGVRFAGKNV